MPITLRIIGIAVILAMVLGLGYERALRAHAPSLEETAAAEDAFDSSDHGATTLSDRPDEEIILEVPPPPVMSASGEAPVLRDRPSVRRDGDLAEAGSREARLQDAAPLVDQSSPQESPAARNDPIIEQSTDVPSGGPETDSLDTSESLVDRILAFQRELSFPYEVLEDNEIARRVAPRFPDKCVEGADAEEIVIVRFRITNSGRAFRPAVAVTTNECLNSAAVSAARRTRFTDGFLRDRDYTGRDFILSYAFSKPAL